MRKLNSIDNIELDADCLACDVSEVLVSNNMIEFGHGGYDAMQDLLDNDHEAFLWGDKKCSFINHTEAHDGFMCFSGIIHPVVT